MRKTSGTLALSMKHTDEVNPGNAIIPYGFNWLNLYQGDKEEEMSCGGGFACGVLY